MYNKNNARIKKFDFSLYKREKNTALNTNIAAGFQNQIYM